MNVGMVCESECGGVIWRVRAVRVMAVVCCGGDLSDTVRRSVGMRRTVVRVCCPLYTGGADTTASSTPLHLAASKTLSRLSGDAMAELL